MNLVTLKEVEFDWLRYLSRKALDKICKIFILDCSPFKQKERERERERERQIDRYQVDIHLHYASSFYQAILPHQGNGKRKTWDGITLQVNEAKLRMERGETCGKIHARAMV